MFLKSLLVLGGVPWVFGKVQYMGMSIAGFEFGCDIDGTCPIGTAQSPMNSDGLISQSPMDSDALGQMQHFANDDDMNVFRLPVSWQFLVNNKFGGTLDSNNFGKYDQLMQACLGLGTFCAIDFHNFARFNGQIIGQSSGAVTDAQFADIWSQLATKYKNNDKVIFGLMNEPHDLDVPTWANTVQAAVTAIRNAGASSQMILLPGTDFASAGKFVSSGSGDALIKVTNPDGSIDGLILDLHKYLDINNSGTHAECTTDNVDAFAIAADFLRQHDRKALVSETGAASTDSCFTDFCAQNKFLNDNSDVFLGYIAWSAGAFSTSYLLSLTPSKQNGKYVNNKLAAQCVVAPWANAGPATLVPSATAIATTSPAGGATPSQTEVPTSITAPNSVTGGGKATSTVSGMKTTITPSSATVKVSAGGGIFASSRANQTVSGPITGARTSSSSQASSTGGAGPEMRRFAGGLLAGSLLFAIVL
ncbi:glycoside hydrolase superfamily [Leptodontidium sp. MPI-SDFR-AT-0119]|nr:glycoside hydrolase superfamily [Leptodontidium sp. MPI-SDFR-AT-0119]